MNKIQIQKFRLIGLALKTKTTNENGQSNSDCGNLWQKFATSKYADRIPDRTDDQILAVYHSYDGDYTKPFSYFIDCKVKMDSQVPQGMDSLIIPSGKYHTIMAKGKMPDCIMNAWRGIWNSDMNRAYQFDFELYDERGKDWSNAEVEIFISVQ